MKFPLKNGFLEYDVTGKGIPILFIHGYPLSKKIWDGQREAFSKIATIITVDLRGHGASYPFEGPYSMDLLAEDCYQLLRDIGINTKFVVCGLSMGGYIIFALYRKYPQLFKGMILASTRAAADSDAGKNNRDHGIESARNNGVAPNANEMLSKILSPVTLKTKPELVSTVREVMLETSVNGMVGALQAMRDRIDSTPTLSQITCPTLIVHGADDQLIPRSEAQAMQDKIPGSTLVVIPEAGHLVNIEQPEKFNQAVEGFIQSLSQDR